VVCISENDACGVDAIQVALGCTVGKGNLLFHMTGKQAFSFYNRQSGRSVRLMLKEKAEGMTREQSLAYYQSIAPEDMFDVMPTRIPLPERAKIFRFWKCDSCGERPPGTTGCGFRGTGICAGIASSCMTVLKRDVLIYD